MTTNLEIYDTTLRDGSQQEGISLTVSDKLRIARLLDDLGVGYIEGGWPGALIAQEKLRHKTRKQSFRIVFGLTVLFNGVMLVTALLVWAQ